MAEDTRKGPSQWDPPPGRYTMRIDAVEHKLTADADKPFLLVTFFISAATDPRWLDRAWKKRMYLTAKAVKITHQDLLRMGASMQALERPELLVQEEVEFECDLVDAGRWVNMKNITPHLNLHPVPPTGPVAPDPDPEPQPEPAQGTPGFYDW